MDVSPQTLREVEFRQALRGYNSDDVDEFLDRVAAGIEILQDRLRQATERAVRAEQRLAEPAETDESMRRTLLLAQRTADLAVQESREQANRVLAAAEARARDILAGAESDNRRAAQEAQRGLRREIADLERARNALQADIAAFERHLSTERSRVTDVLSDVVRRLEEHALKAVRPPAPRPVNVPPEIDLGDEPMVAETPDDVENGDEPHGMDLSPHEESSLDQAGDELSVDADVEEHDAFLAELRLAATDTEPLGPRHDDEPFFDQDEADAAARDAASSD